MSKLLYWAVALTILFRGTARADEQADAQAVVDAAIKAQGGEAALAKVVGIVFKGKGSSFDNGEKMPMAMEFYIQGNDKIRMVSYDELNKVDSAEIVNGNQGWTKSTDQATVELSAGQVAARRELIYLNWALLFVPLKAPEFQLETLKEATVDGRPVDCIMVTHKGHNPLKLCFDRQTHLLAKYERKAKNDDGTEYHEECIYSDFRDVQGTKQPFRSVGYADGVKASDITLTEQKFYEKPLDESLFGKP